MRQPSHWDSTGLYALSAHKGVFIYFSGASASLYFAYIVWVLGEGTYSKERRRFRDRQEVIAQVTKARQAEKTVEDRLSLESVTVLNRTLMDDYHRITKDQAAQSFKHSQLAMLAGLGILLLGVTVALAPSSAEVKITVGALSGIGAAISGYISNTFLTSYNIAISQINRFFQQPLVTSYLLNAERISRDLGNKEEILTNISAESITAARLILTDSTAKIRPGRRRITGTSKPETATSTSN